MFYCRLGAHAQSGTGMSRVRAPLRRSTRGLCLLPRLLLLATCLPALAAADQYPSRGVPNQYDSLGKTAKQRHHVCDGDVAEATETEEGRSAMVTFFGRTLMIVFDELFKPAWLEKGDVAYKQNLSLEPQVHCKP